MSEKSGQPTRQELDEFIVKTQATQTVTMEEAAKILALRSAIHVLQGSRVDDDVYYKALEKLFQKYHDLVNK